MKVIEQEIKILMTTPADWGRAAMDSLVVLKDAASLLARHFPNRPEQINVIRAADGIPRSILGEPTIALATEPKARNYDQLAYQFAHELFHKLTGDERLAKTPHCTYQIDEILAETASFFTLRKLRDKWKKNAPRHGLSYYSAEFEKYITRIEESYAGVPQGPIYDKPLEEPCNRQRNGYIAIRLQHLFWKTPGFWAATQHLPAPEQNVHQFLRQWIEGCPFKDAATAISASLENIT